MGFLLYKLYEKIPLKTPFIFWGDYRTTETLLYFAHVYSNGIQFLKRCAALGLPFLWASPGGVTLVCGLFGLWPLCSKREQLFFS